MKTNINLNDKTILITGSAGFIGFHLSKRLLDQYNNIRIIGLDNLSDYYDIELKEERLSLLNKYPNYSFAKVNIADKETVNRVFNCYKPDIVVNLAAQAGVRYSIDHPDIYVESNIVGFFNMLDACRNNNIEHFIYASSSSVYGNRDNIPFKEEDNVDTPESLYASTKRCDELLAYTYSKLYNIPCTGLRFFTVYGPLGRPDMAYFNFAKKLISGEKIELYNNGKCKRDYTYIDDIVEGIIRVSRKSPQDDVPYSIYNIGNSNPVDLFEFVNVLKEELINVGLLDKDFNLEEHIKLLPMQKGDVVNTYADTSKLTKDFNFSPDTSLRDGVKEFCKWYKDYLKKEKIKNDNKKLVKK